MIRPTDLLHPHSCCVAASAGGSLIRNWPVSWHDALTHQHVSPQWCAQLDTCRHFTIGSDPQYCQCLQTSHCCSWSSACKKVLPGLGVKVQIAMCNSAMCPLYYAVLAAEVWIQDTVCTCDKASLTCQRMHCSAPGGSRLLCG